MHLSDNIAGVTILAFGNGAPDIFTSVAAGEEGRIIMFTELIGAGVFVTLIIAGTVAITRPFQVSLGSLVRDICFYIFSVCWITIVVWDEIVSLLEAASTSIICIQNSQTRLCAALMFFLSRRRGILASRFRPLFVSLCIIRLIVSSNTIKTDVCVIS